MRRTILFVVAVTALACAESATEPRLTSVNAVAFGKKPVPLFPPLDTIVIPPCNPITLIDTVSTDPLVTDTSLACTNPQ